VPTADGDTEKLSDDRRREETTRRAWRFSHHSMEKYALWMRGICQCSETVFFP
jgi:hypothetical protein